MDVKLLLKRGALLAAANWPLVAIQFVAETTFQVLLAVPIIGAAILVAVLLGADLAKLLQGGMREMFGTISAALVADPVAFGAFIVAFAIALGGGAMLMFLVKGGVMDILIAANAAAGPIEREALTLDTLRTASGFSLARFVSGCARLFRRYLALGALLTLAYGLSGVAYVALIVYGYRAAGDGLLFFGWAFVAALITLGLLAWLALVNVTYLLAQLIIAADNVGAVEALRAIVQFVRRRFRPLGGVFLVVLAMVVGATFVSALAWSGVGLVAFVPLVGLAVFPLQIAALLVRGLIFEYIGITALGAYLALYRPQGPADATV